MLPQNLLTFLCKISVQEATEEGKRGTFAHIPGLQSHSYSRGVSAAGCKYANKTANFINAVAVTLVQVRYNNDASIATISRMFCKFALLHVYYIAKPLKPIATEKTAAVMYCCCCFVAKEGILW